MRRSVIFAVSSMALLLLAPSVHSAAASGDLLARVGQQVSTSFEQLSRLKCTESVVQAKLVTNGGKNAVEYREEQTFDYRLVAHPSGDDLVIQESRQQQRSSKHTSNVPLLVTNGFATLALVLHPSYQSAFEFSAPENETVSKQRLIKINFRHLKGRRTPTVLMLRGHEYPLEMRGVAWIDPATATIVRIQAELQEDMSDLGLHTLMTEEGYAPTRVQGFSAPMWLPATATIELTTPTKRWRNVHRFTKYQSTTASMQSPGRNP